MNFTLQIKNELISQSYENACCRVAALSAFIRLSGSIMMKGGSLSFEAVTESERAAEYFINILESVYGAEIIISEIKKDNLSKKDKLTFECRGEKAAEILKDLGIIELSGGGYSLKMQIDRYILENRCCRLSYIKGAFIGGGSCTLPKLNLGATTTGYHLEFVFSNRTLADSFLRLLEFENIAAKLSARKESFIVYIKSSEMISDLLALLGASQAVLALSNIVVRKAHSNNINRTVNCSLGNLMKQTDASVRQIQAIRRLEKSKNFDNLTAELQAAARARLKNQGYSLTQLSEELGISKSCLNHRLRKIIEIAKSEDEDVN